MINLIIKNFQVYQLFQEKGQKIKTKASVRSSFTNGSFVK